MERYNIVVSTVGGVFAYSESGEWAPDLRAVADSEEETADYNRVVSRGVLRGKSVCHRIGASQCVWVASTSAFHLLEITSRILKNTYTSPLELQKTAEKIIDETRSYQPIQIDLPGSLSVHPMHVVSVLLVVGTLIIIVSVLLTCRD